MLFHLLRVNGLVIIVKVIIHEIFYIYLFLSVACSMVQIIKQLLLVLIYYLICRDGG